MFFIFRNSHSIYYYYFYCSNRAEFAYYCYSASGWEGIETWGSSSYCFEGIDWDHNKDSFGSMEEEVVEHNSWVD